MLVKRRGARDAADGRAQRTLFERPSALQDLSTQSSRLVGSLCAACGNCYYPRQATCMSCGGDMLEDVPLSRKGRLETFAIIRHASPDHEVQLPYAIGTIMLPEGIRLRAFLNGHRLEDLRTGMEIELGLVKPQSNLEAGEEHAQVLQYAWSA